jgi:hypothetical protein
MRQHRLAHTQTAAPIGTQNGSMRACNSVRPVCLGPRPGGWRYG